VFWEERMMRLICAGFAVLVMGIGAALAQDWPSRPVTLVVPYAAGGPVDTVGRILASGLGEALGQQVVVENVGGAGGMVGASRVAKAEADGYTVLLGGSAVLAINQAIYKKPLYDGASDFTPVALFADSARVLIARKDFPATTLTEFNAYAKANGGKMQYGSAGHGSGSHVCAALLNTVNGTKIAHVAYRGTAQGMQDLVGGRIDFICEQISTAVGHISSGTVKAIAILGPDRLAVLPDLGTAREQGLADLDCNSWAAVVLPKGAPDVVVRRLSRAVDEAINKPMLRKRLEQVGVAIAPPERRTPEYLAKYIPSEIARWGAVLRGAGIALD
jgi:tripartite-type tricarboxylate transporter receptor subunit TctC